MKPANQLKIAFLGGSLRERSCSYLLLNHISKMIEEKRISHQLIDLRQFNLPFCNGAFDYPEFPDVLSLRNSLLKADGILLVTPEYHGSISGVLKNALDLLDEKTIAGKVVGLISVVGGTHSTNALNTLRIICRQLHSWVLPQQLVIPYSEKNIDLVGQIKDPNLAMRLELFIEQFLIASQRFGGFAD